MKLYILVRTDVELPLGKIMAHCVHNSVRSFYNNMDYEDLHPRHSEWYYKNDTTTIVLNGKSRANILSIMKKAEQMGIPTSFVEDNTVETEVCAAIGPVTAEEALDLGLKKLRLFK